MLIKGSVPIEHALISIKTLMTHVREPMEVCLRDGYFDGSFMERFTAMLCATSAVMATCETTLQLTVDAIMSEKMKGFFIGLHQGPPNMDVPPN